MGITRFLKDLVFAKVIQRRTRLVSATRSVQFLAWRAQVRLQKFINRRSEDPDGLLYVDPSLIRSYIGGLPWSRYAMRGRVVGGDWDLDAKPFAPWDVNRALEARFERGATWEDTKLYHRVAAEIEAGHVRWGCSTIEEFRARLQGLDRLYDEIGQNGFRSQDELGVSDRHSWEKQSPFKPYDEVTVCIDRDGHFLLRDGKHRLSIAKILRLTTIPVAVGVRHRNWVNVKRELAHAIASRGGKSHQSFTHPDLRLFSSTDDDSRFEWIRKELRLTEGTLIDIGSRFGYFCHKFESIGFECTLIEVHREDRYFTTILRDAEYRTFETRNESILDGSEVLRFDVVLALDTLHSLIEPPGSLKRLKNLLRRLDATVMFLEPHSASDQEKNRAGTNLTPDEFLRFVVEHSVFADARRIAVDASGQPLYMLTR